MKAGTGLFCLGCKAEVRPEQEICKCGDRVRPKDRLKPLPEVPPRPMPEEYGTLPVLDPAALRAPKSVPAGDPPENRLIETGLTLSAQQHEALDAIAEWFSTPFRKAFFLTGPAGTGKTTLAKHVGQAIGTSNVVYGAYTGKAAHVLRKKGVPATTIHSAIYTPMDNYEARAELREAQRAWDAITQSAAAISSEQEQHEWMHDENEARLRVEQLEAQIRRPGFELNPDSPWADADLIVLDEISMVNEGMAQDIESFGVPVLVLGDKAQLPPIEGGGYYTKREPDYRLTEVHRQALESPVYALCTDIRKGVPWPTAKVSLAEAMEADQIICWKNATRWNLIEKIRAKLGRPAGRPVSGDRIMCLVNNRNAGILNGQQFEVLGVLGEGTDAWVLHTRDDEGNERHLAAYADGFRGLAAEQEARNTLRAFRGRRGLFTFANVITCHKAQGSEWPSVYVVDQTHQMTRDSAADKRRWIYTASSRASESVTIASTRAP